MLRQRLLQHVVLSKDDAAHALAIGRNPKERPWRFLSFVARGRRNENRPLVLCLSTLELAGYPKPDQDKENNTASD